MTIAARIHRIATEANGVGVSWNLTQDDARELDRIIADTCPDETACRTCNARLCDTCGVGESWACAASSVDLHCESCLPDCSACSADRREEGEWP